MVRFYAPIVMFASVCFLTACGSPPPDPTVCDATALHECENWIPDSKAICYDTPQPSPNPDEMCGGFGEMGMTGEHTKWCCAPKPVPHECDSASECAIKPCMTATCTMAGACSYAMVPGCTSCQTVVDCPAAPACHVAACSADGSCTSGGVPNGTPCGPGKLCQDGACVISAH